VLTNGPPVPLSLEENKKTWRLLYQTTCQASHNGAPFQLMYQVLRNPHTNAPMTDAELKALGRTRDESFVKYDQMVPADGSRIILTPPRAKEEGLAARPRGSGQAGGAKGGAEGGKGQQEGPFSLLPPPGFDYLAPMDALEDPARASAGTVQSAQYQAARPYENAPLLPSPHPMDADVEHFDSIVSNALLPLRQSANEALRSDPPVRVQPLPRRHSNGARYATVFADLGVQAGDLVLIMSDGVSDNLFIEDIMDQLVRVDWNTVHKFVRLRAAKLAQDRRLEEELDAEAAAGGNADDEARVRKALPLENRRMLGVREHIVTDAEVSSQEKDVRAALAAIANLVAMRARDRGNSMGTPTPRFHTQGKPDDCTVVAAIVVPSF
jgi:hypothetical protein